MEEREAEAGLPWRAGTTTKTQEKVSPGGSGGEGDSGRSALQDEEAY